jgi:hypothetical protein
LPRDNETLLPEEGKAHDPYVLFINISLKTTCAYIERNEGEHSEGCPVASIHLVADKV